MESSFRTETARRLNIGGKAKEDGWEILNVNPASYVDHVCNANDLSRFSSDTFTVIYASHIVEHLDYKSELADTLKEWHRVLQPGGQVMISVPDLDALSELLIANSTLTVDERFFVMRMMFGGHEDEYDYHYVGLNQAFLTRFLAEAGYVNIRRVSELGLFNDASGIVFKGVRISLSMIAEKSQQPGSRSGSANKFQVDIQSDTSGPRFESKAGYGDDAVVLRSADGLLISVPATLNCFTTYVLLEQEQWFEREFGFVHRWLKSGANVVDVGANVGVCCLLLAHAVGEAGQVIAFEPGSENRRHLESSRLANGLTNLTVFPCALSDTESNGWLNIAESGELNSLVNGSDRTTAGESVQVSTLDIQNQECRWPPIDFVKIDAKGQEARIVVGGRAFFAHHSPLVMYEFKHGTVGNTGLRWLFEVLGYKSYRLLGDASLLVPVASDEVFDHYELNLFAAKPDRAATMAEQGFLVLESATLSLSDREKTQALDRMMELPYARALEFSVEDVLECPYGESIIIYAAYRFLNLSPVRRFAALGIAYEMMSTWCLNNPTPTGLATFIRIALDLGRREPAVKALKQLVREKGVALDQPFFPPCARYETVSSEGREADWFVAASHEQLEMSADYSSCSGSSDPAWLKWLCESPFSSPEISRRMILRAARDGATLSDLVAWLRSDQTHANSSYWTPTGLLRIQSLL